MCILWKIVYFTFSLKGINLFDPFNILRISCRSPIFHYETNFSENSVYVDVVICTL